MACICGICEENIARNKACLQCKICDGWFHSSCAEISDKELTFLKNNKSLSYTCDGCARNPNPAADDIRSLNKKIDSYMSKGQDDLRSIKAAFSDAVSDIKENMNSCLKEMKLDITNCNKFIRQIESSTAARMSSIEHENHILHRRLNRSDIVIRGLPGGLDDLVVVVVALGAFYKIPVSIHDISHVCYINQKKLILVKFSNTFVRDKIMKEYFKTRTLRRCDIIDDGVAAADVGNRVTDRVFLNDHLSPASSRLNSACRKLLADKIISKYKLFNADKLSARLTLPDGKEIDVYDAAGCSLLRKDSVSVIN